MDQQALRESAEKLQSLLAQYAPLSQTARALQNVLVPWIDAALSGRIQESIDSGKIPGGCTFEESDARDTLPGLESAYADFKIEASGSEPESLKIFRARHGLFK